MVQRRKIQGILRYGTRIPEECIKELKVSDLEPNETYISKADGTDGNHNTYIFKNQNKYALNIRDNTFIRGHTIPNSCFIRFFRASPFEKEYLNQSISANRMLGLEEVIFNESQINNEYELF